MSGMYEQPSFSAFNSHAPVRVYHRNLPHWRQDGATYFMTFRLGDSIPKQKLLQWQDEDELWLSGHGVERSSGPFSGAGENGAEHRSAELEDILASVKGFVSTRLSKLGFKKGMLWQQENYERLVRDGKELAVGRKYIRQNPEKADLRVEQFTRFECDWL